MKYKLTIRTTRKVNSINGDDIVTNWETTYNTLEEAEEEVTLDKEFSPTGKEYKIEEVKE